MESRIDMTCWSRGFPPGICPSRCVLLIHCRRRDLSIRERRVRIARTIRSKALIESRAPQFFLRYFSPPRILVVIRRVLRITLPAHPRGRTQSCCPVLPAEVVSNIVREKRRCAVSIRRALHLPRAFPSRRIPACKRSGCHSCGPSAACTTGCLHYNQAMGHSTDTVPQPYVHPSPAS